MRDVEAMPLLASRDPNPPDYEWNHYEDNVAKRYKVDFEDALKAVVEVITCSRVYGYCMSQVLLALDDGMMNDGMMLSEVVSQVCQCFLPEDIKLFLCGFITQCVP